MKTSADPQLFTRLKSCAQASPVSSSPSHMSPKIKVGVLQVDIDAMASVPGHSQASTGRKQLPLHTMLQSKGAKGGRLGGG